MSLLCSTSPMLWVVIGRFLPHADLSAWGFAYLDISDVGGEEFVESVSDVVGEEFVKSVFDVAGEGFVESVSDVGGEELVESVSDIVGGGAVGWGLDVVRDDGG